MATTSTPEISDIEARPVLDKRGFAVLFDLYVAGEWVGSRRTVEQCEDWLTYYIGAPIHAYSRGAW